MKKSIYFVLALLILTALACSFSASTANIKEAKIAKDSEGSQPTTTFAQDEPFYAVVVLANASDDTKVKAVWIAVEAEGVDPNTTIDEAELTSGDGQLTFDLTNDKLWPVGKYKVDLYLNDKLDRSLEFAVEGSAASQAPEPTAEPSPTPEPTKEPTPTPQPKPTATPKPTAEPTAEPTEAAIAGDTLTLPTAEPTAEIAEAFPDEPPPGDILFQEKFDNNRNDWPTGKQEDEYGVSNSEFVDGRYQMSQKAKQGVFIWNTLNETNFDDFAFSVEAQPIKHNKVFAYGMTFREDAEFGDLYVFEVDTDGYYSVSLLKDGEWETLEQWAELAAINKEGPNELMVKAAGPVLSFYVNGTAAASLYNDGLSSGSIGLALDMFEAGDDATAEFDNVVVRALSAEEKTELEALASSLAPSDETPQIETPDLGLPEPTTPAPPPPPPPPTPTPVPAGPAIPAGKGMLVMLNCRGDVINVDVIPVGIFQELAPKTGENCQPGQPIFLDPGEYILKASIAGQPSSGEATITIVAGKGLEFTWN